MMSKEWRVYPAQPQRAHTLAEAMGIHPLTAQLLLNRGLTTTDTAQRFLSPSTGGFEDPMRLPGMRQTIDRLRQAMASHEEIELFGDSDTDGLTATAILYEALRSQGVIPRVTLANRIRDGYGVPLKWVREVCHRQTSSVVILLDCGTNEAEAVEQFTSSGIDVIVLDHHVPLERPARPFALVNPHAAHSVQGGWCSAGLAFKVTQALWEDRDPQQVMRCLDLAALGTLADCSPLTGDNRTIVAKGMRRIVDSHRLGLQRLCEETETRMATPEHILRRLVPRLNASGRLGDPNAVWQLLVEEREDRVEGWMAQARAAHVKTKQHHRRLMGEAQAQVSRLHFRDQYVIVVRREGWLPGLMGPLAAQLAQRYERPAIAIALQQGRGVGSARSTPSVNLLELLQGCCDMLESFGGHAQACGLTVLERHLEAFEQLVNHQAKRVWSLQGMHETERIDVELPLDDVESRWVEELDDFEPFGYGNPRPTILLRAVRLEPHSPRRGMAFGEGKKLSVHGVMPPGNTEKRYDVIVTPKMTREELMLVLQDVRDAQAPCAPVQKPGTTCTRESAASDH